jgi:hypothetical protein
MDPLIDIPLLQVSLEHVEQRLIRPGYREDVHIDYKQEFDLRAEKHVRKLLQTVAAFANAQGGLLLYGIEEEKDEEGRRTGLPAGVVGLQTGDIEQFRLGLQQLLTSSIDEPIPGLEVHTLPLGQDEQARWLLLLRMPASLRAPHRVDYRGGVYFHRRINGGNEPMKTAQIRDTVLQAADLETRVSRFVDARLNSIAPEQTYFSMHIVPLVRQPMALDITRASIRNRLRDVRLSDYPSVEHEVCLEGFRNQFELDGSRTHTLFFRDGTIEHLDQIYLAMEPAEFDALEFERQIFTVFRNSRGLFDEGLVTTPATVCVRLTLQNERKFRHGLRYIPRISSPRITGTVRPEHRIMQDATTEPEDLFRPMLHLIWNAAGFNRCPAYDADGTYVGYRDQESCRKRLSL